MRVLGWVSLLAWRVYLWLDTCRWFDVAGKLFICGSWSYVWHERERNKEQSAAKQSIWSENGVNKGWLSGSSIEHVCIDGRVRFSRLAVSGGEDIF